MHRPATARSAPGVAPSSSPTPRGGAAAVLVALLALAGLIAAVWWFAGREDPGGGALAREERAAAEGAADAGELAAPAPRDGAAAGGGEARVEVADADDAASEEARDEVPRVAISGTAQLPAGTPSDERPHVIALAAERTHQRLADDPSAIEAVLEGERHPALLGSAAVADDGTWTLQVPADREAAHLALVGRYVAPLQTTRVAVGSDERPELGARLGAWVTVTVVPPDRVPDTDVVLEGVEVQLGPDVTAELDVAELQRSAVKRDRVTDAEGTVSFHAVIEPGPKSVVWKHDVHAGGVRLDVATEPGRHVRVEVPLAVGGRIAGRTEDAAGEPVRLAKVEARLRGAVGQLAEVLRDAETDAAGAFALEHLPAGEYELTITHPERRRTHHVVEGRLEDGGLLDGVVVVMSEGGRLGGVVVHPGGAPAAGARVRATPDLSSDIGGFGTDRDPSAEFEDRADEVGAFTLRGLDEGAFYVEAEWEDETDGTTWGARRGGVRAGDEDVVLELERLASLSGVVRDAQGAVVEDFHVRAELQGSGAMFGIGAERETETLRDRTDGMFTLDGLRPGTWLVLVSAEGYARSEQVEVEIPRPDGAPPVDFVLPEICVVTGIVVDSAGVPLDGARVARELDLAEQVRASMSGGARETYSDADGAFRLELDPGAHALVATHEDFAVSEAVPVELAEGRTLEGVELRLRTGGTLTGVVRDEEGRPRTDRSVILQSIPASAQPTILQTDGDGAFEKHHLEPGVWQVVVVANILEMSAEDRSAENQARMLGDMLIETVTIVDGETTHLELGGTETRPVEVDGVVAHAGEPVDGAMVSFIPEDSQGMSDLKMSSTDEDGRYSVRLPHGGAWLVTVQDDLATGRQNSIEYLERIPDSAATHSLDFELPGGRISGRVLGPRGEPIGGCRVTLNVEGGIAYGSLLGGHYTETATDGDGRYEIRYLRAGTYAVAAGGPELGGMFGDDAPHGRVVKGAVELEEGQWRRDVDFRLESPGRLTGVVRDADGSAVAGAAIFLRDANGRMVERFALVETDAGGRFTYRGLAPGGYTAFARKASQVSPTSDPFEVRAAAESEVTLALEEGCVLLVRVQDESGEDVRARVSVVDGAGREVTGTLSMSEVLEKFGAGFSSKEQRVGPLPLGRYRVRAVADDGRETDRPVTLLRPGERSVRLKLE